MVSRRDKIHSASDLKYEEMFIEPWDVGVGVRGLTALERGKFEDRDKGDGYVAVDLLIDICWDPDEGQESHLFEPADRDWLATKDGEIIESIAKRIFELSGVDVEAAEARVRGNPT